MKLQNKPELDRLIGYTAAMSRYLNGCNYVTWFSARSIELDDSDLDAQLLDRFIYPGTTPDLQIQSLILLAYPGAKPELGSVCECSSMMVGQMNQFISYVNSHDGASNITKFKKQSLISGFWVHVKDCIDFEKARVFQYTPSINAEDELWDFVFWGFTFIIIDTKQNHCFLIHCGASD
jgi:hypothetical protein